MLQLRPGTVKLININNKIKSSLHVFANDGSFRLALRGINWMGEVVGKEGRAAALLRDRKASPHALSSKALWESFKVTDVPAGEYPYPC